MTMTALYWHYKSVIAMIDGRQVSTMRYPCDQHVRQQSLRGSLGLGARSIS